MTTDYDLAVVGAGAAGLMTAIAAGRALRAAAPTPVPGPPPEPGTLPEPGPAPLPSTTPTSGARIVLIEGKRRPGAKILISGGGRCNVTNRVVLATDFQGNRRGIDRVLRRFGAQDAVAFFEELGVRLVHEPEFDKLFPSTNKAKSVLEALLDEAQRVGVELRSDFRVDSVSRPAPAADGSTAFRVAGAAGTLTCARIVLATGGRSVPKTGSDGLGYEFARALGHTVTPTAAALVPLLLAPHPFEGLSGIAAPVELSAWENNRCLARVRGPMLITHQGLSGPAPMDISRHVTVAENEARKVVLRVSFVPGVEADELERTWLEIAAHEGRIPVASLFRHLPARLADRVFRIADVDPSWPLAQLGKSPRKDLLRAATSFPLPVIGTRGFDYAEVTAGGVPLSEVNLATLESKRTPGAYLVGEILDVDGRIGGFNFQWAWSTGHLAGTAAARSLPTPS